MPNCSVSHMQSEDSSYESWVGYPG